MHISVVYILLRYSMLHCFHCTVNGNIMTWERLSPFVEKLMFIILAVGYVTSDKQPMVRTKRLQQFDAS